MSRTMKSRSALALLMGLAMLMTMLVVPASADPVAGAAVARGRAFIGSTLANKGTKAQECQGSGGLNFPATVNPSHPTIVKVAPNKTVCYAFDTDEPVVGPPNPPGSSCDSVGVLRAPGVGVERCRIAASGTVTQALGTNLGGFCGHSRGTNGKGIFTTPTLNLQLNDLGWDASVGSLFVVTGTWTDKAGKGGTIVALVQASGNTSNGSLAQSCNIANGADGFDVNIVAVLA